jgi:hypothetical protein
LGEGGDDVDQNRGADVFFAVDEEAVADAGAAVVAEVDYRPVTAEEGGERREEDLADGAFVGGRRGAREAVAGEIGDEEGDFGAQIGEDVSPPVSE